MDAVRRFAVLIMWSCLAGHLAYASGVVPPGLLPATFFTGWLHHVGYTASAAACLLAALRGDHRRSWLWLAAALATWTAGSVYWALAIDGSDALLSAADALWLAFYPLAYCFVVLRARETMRQLPWSAWLDGLVGGLAAGALVSLLVPAALDAGFGSSAIAAVYLAYPIGDVAMVALIVGTVAVTSGRVTWDWLLVTLGIAIFAVADLIYLRQNATGSYELGTLLDSGWAAGMAIMAHGAIRGAAGARRATDNAGRRVLVVPSVFALLALGVLVFSALSEVRGATLVLGALAVVAAIARSNLTLREVQALSISRRQAVTDELTNLPNRRLFRERLREAVERAEAARRAGEDTRLAVVVLDLDRFKEVNDTLGHHAGDVFLCEVARRCAATVKGGTLSRLGGDEFAFLLAGPLAAEEAVRLVSSIKFTLRRPVRVHGVDVAVDASIGLAFYPGHGRTAEDLFRRADVAMYQAKRERSCYRIYAPELDDHSCDRLALVAALRRGVETGQLVVHYQPQVALVTGAIRGLEALVRWEHPTRGLLGPQAFLPAAEHTGLMKAVSTTVLETAISQVARWRSAGIDTSVAVNLSPSDLLDADLVPTIEAALDRHGVPPSRLRLEITETMVIGDVTRAVRVTKALRAHGIGIALDDFGTGHSTLVHLTRLEVDEIKIDQSFVRWLVESRPEAIIVRSTVDMAHRLGLRVVAEGVEDAATREALLASGCQLAQGYYFARPLPADQVTPLLVAGTSMPDGLAAA